MPPNPPVPQWNRAESAESLLTSDDEILRLLASELSLSKSPKQRRRRGADNEQEKDSVTRNRQSRHPSSADKETDRQIDTSAALRARVRDMDKDRERLKEPVCFADSAEEARAHVRVRDGEHEFVSSFADTTITSAPPVETRKSRSTTTLSESAHMPGKGVLKKDARGGSRSADRRHTRGISSTSGRSKSPVQSWTSLVKREEDHKERYNTSTKTLLQSLSDERSRYAALEQSYQQLLADVRSLQTNHQSDLQHAKRKSESALRALQRALIVKTDEHASAEKELSLARAKYDKDSATWLATAHGLEQQVQAGKRELASAVASHDELLADAEAAYKVKLGDVEAKLAQRESEVKRLAQAYKAKEADWVSEREGRMKLDMRQLELDHELGRRKDENVAMQQRMERLSQELSEARSANRAAGSLIEKQRSELSAVQQNLEQAREDHDAVTAEIDRLATEKAKMEAEKDGLVMELRDRDREILDMGRDLDAGRNENKERLLQFTETLDEVRTALVEAQREAKDLKDRETSVRRDKQRLEDELRVALERATVAEERLEVETEQRSKDRTQTHAELLSLQEKLTVAKSAMEDEVSHLRTSLAEKNTALDALSAEHASVLRRCEELSQELARARSQMQHKSQHTSALSEELSKLRMESSEASGRIFALDARVAEMEAVETALRRQVGSLQAQLADKERQLLVAVEKQKVVLEQVRRLDEELQHLRSSPTRLETPPPPNPAYGQSLWDLSRRIKANVESLIPESGIPPTYASQNLQQSRSTTSTRGHRPSNGSQQTVSSGSNQNVEELQRTSGRAPSGPMPAHRPVDFDELLEKIGDITGSIANLSGNHAAPNGSPYQRSNSAQSAARLSDTSGSSPRRGVRLSIENLPGAGSSASSPLTDPTFGSPGRSFERTMDTAKLERLLEIDSIVPGDDKRRFRGD